MAESVKSAERAMLVLALLTRRVEGLTFSEICAALDLPKSSAHALLATLCASGFVAQTSDPERRYRLGVRAWEAGQAYRAGNALEVACPPFLRAVRDALQESAHLAVLDGTDTVYLAKADADHQLAFVFRIGARRPAHASAVGRVLLSGLDDIEVRRRFATPRARGGPAQVADSGQLLAELAEIRVSGFAVDPGEQSTGLFSVAAPVRDHTGAVCAGIGVSLPTVRCGVETRRQAKMVLGAQADGLSARLGHHTD